MQFDHKDIKNHVKVVYGHREGSRSFDVVMTLEIIGESAIVHGFLDRRCQSHNPCGDQRPMGPDELIAMWNYIKESAGTRYIEFEALPDHARFYKQFLHVESCHAQKTFDGHEAEHLKVDMNKGIKHFSQRSAT